MPAKRPEFREKFAIIKLMLLLSHVLVMYDCHILFNVLCIASVGNKHVKRVLQNYLGFLVCTTDTCMYYVCRERDVLLRICTRCM